MTMFHHGNRIYTSLGNIVENPNIGMLFMKIGAEEGQDQPTPAWKELPRIKEVL